MSSLSTDTLKAISQLRDRGPTPQSALLSALRLVQHEHGRVGQQEVQAVAALLGLSPALVDGVARFYDQISREPVGGHVVSVCRGIACYLRGAEPLLQQVERVLVDGSVTLRRVECIGDCDHAPAALLDDAFIGPVSIDSLKSRLEHA
jgi:NADH-quinone oxidoreductase subunit E